MIRIMIKIKIESYPCLSVKSVVNFPPSFHHSIIWLLRQRR